VTAVARKRALCSSSGGKDSLLALLYAGRQSLRPTTLLTMFDETGLRSRSHGVPRALVERQAQSLGLDLVAPSAGWTNYEPVFIQALTDLKLSGHEVAVFGDIDLEPHREWEARVCAVAGLEHCLPLWQRNRLELARESIALGFEAIVVCVDSRYLADDFCGRVFDESFIEDLPPGVDACGENGEFHTFVFDGPLFARRLDIRVQGRSEYIAPAQFGRQRYCFANLAG
jgi:diphthine-ammonia ligase